MFVRSGEILSPGPTSIDKTNDCAMKAERGAPVRGFDPPSGDTVLKTTGEEAGAGQASDTNTFWSLLCRKQARKNLDPSPMAKNRPFCRFGRRAFKLCQKIRLYGNL